MLGPGRCAVDPGEEGGLGEVHQGRVQVKRLSDDFLDSPAHISNRETRDGTRQDEGKHSSTAEPKVCDEAVIFLSVLLMILLHFLTEKVRMCMVSSNTVTGADVNKTGHVLTDNIVCF